MKIAVLGVGMIGSVAIQELTSFRDFTEIMAVDSLEENIKKCKEISSDKRIVGKVKNLNSKQNIHDILREADIAISCLPHSLSMLAIEAAIDAKCHLIDLVGSHYNKKIEFNSAAKNAEVLIVPGCGVAPGIINFLAARGIELLDQADEAVMICGGLPRHPRPPLSYQVVFRLESVLKLYTRPALAVENREIAKLPPLSNKEKLKFPHPVGECEAVVTDAHSTVYTLKDKVNKLYEKTIRYSGHWGKMAVLSELGFLDQQKIDIGGSQVSPIEMSEKILKPKLKGESNEDVTALRVVVKGKKDNENIKHVWEMIDLYDHERQITSMAKTTAIPAVLLATFILKEKIKKNGIVAIENLITGDHLFDSFTGELSKKGIEINYKKLPIGHDQTE